MIELTALHAALLNLGLEDWIPLPEAVETARFEGLVDAGESVAKISRALVDLLGEDRIQVWSGPWEAEQPSPVSPELAESMLLDYRRYSFASETSGLERVFYVNVEKFLALYNSIRPHEELDFYTPSDAFHGRFVPNPKIIESVQDS